MILITKFYADWCGPCKVVGPRLDELLESDEYKGRFSLESYNVDENPVLVEQYHVKGIPAIFFSVKGETVHNAIGLHSSKELKNILDKCVEIENNED